MRKETVIQRQQEVIQKGSARDCLEFYQAYPGTCLDALHAAAELKTDYPDVASEFSSIYLGKIHAQIDEQLKSQSHLLNYFSTHIGSQKFSQNY